MTDRSERAAGPARQAHGSGERPAPDGPTGKARRIALAFALAGAVAMLNAAVWWALNPPLAAPDAPQRVGGLAYNAFQRWDGPLAQRFPSLPEVEQDLKQLAPRTGQLRSYSAAELPQLPALAAQAGLQLTLGLWLDQRKANNELEVQAAIDATRQPGAVKRLIVGNETLLHGKLKLAELSEYLSRVRTLTGLPVSTAEPWHIWLLQPELAERVDFITVHLLPYWEGVPLQDAVDDALARYEQVRRRFPGKPVLIGEVGWPSAGNPVKQAQASPAAQAVFVRQFVVRAEAMKLDYFLMEAVDQPWKQATEGTVGAHWGLLDAQRQPKFAFEGTVRADPYWRAKAGAATLAGLLAMLPFLWRFAHMRLAGRVAFALMAQAVASFAVLLVTRPFEHYLRLTDWLMLAVLVPALMLMAAMLLAQCFEFAELYWRGSLRRRVTADQGPAADPADAPLVSIHLACSNEPPETVIQAIDSLVALQWPRLEIVVVDNNTQDPSQWQPLQAHVEALWARGAARRAPGDEAAGPTLRFFHLPEWPGYKAGALNFALRHTDADAQWVAVVDADYAVEPQWLARVAAWLRTAEVGIVQAPQAHRQWQAHRLTRMMNWEYEGFFRIGMHHRHERNAIIQHGTMTLIRRDALDRLGGWDEGCICEDTELGLRVLQAGWRAVYVDEVMGAGLVPADFRAYRRQRQRWAQGGMQILRQHWRALLMPTTGGLGLGQRYHFLAGWLPWLGDALHLVFSLLLMLWSVGFLLAPQFFGLPLWLFVVPLAIFFAARALLGPLLYRRRVPCSAADTAGAAVAGMGLSHSVAQGVLAGLTAQPAQFHVTRRTGSTTAVPARGAWWSVVREESALLVGLWVCAAALASQVLPGDAALAVWIGLLVVQSLPYAAAIYCAWLSRRPPSRRRRAAAGADDAGRSRSLRVAPASRRVAFGPADTPGSAPDVRR